MPNLNYAEQWSPELLAILIQGTLTSPIITTCQMVRCKDLPFYTDECKWL